MNNSKKLKQWLVATLADNPKILQSDNPSEVYSKLYEIWLKEVQETFKDIFKAYKTP